MVRRWKGLKVVRLPVLGSLDLEQTVIDNNDILLLNGVFAGVLNDLLHTFLDGVASTLPDLRVDSLDGVLEQEDISTHMVIGIFLD